MATNESDCISKGKVGDCALTLNLANSSYLENIAFSHQHLRYPLPEQSSMGANSNKLEAYSGPDIRQSKT
jgi:transposase